MSCIQHPKIARLVIMIPTFLRYIDHLPKKRVIKPIWWFPEMGVPPVILHFNGSFHEINRPLLGTHILGNLQDLDAVFPAWSTFPSLEIEADPFDPAMIPRESSRRHCPTKKQTNNSLKCRSGCGGGIMFMMFMSFLAV